ncbi:hypothetical protein [Janibacter melonis]|uniref:hypothetical protein n=1 Tax=Janibacter melonis TaxID=262209 RepID=UPI00174CC78D|nr:hypothetical protein [Janibacter melonis]
MITNAYPLHPEKGYRLDLRCPVVVCDACGAVIDAAHPGNLLWGDDEPAVHVHKDWTCASGYRHLPHSQEMGTWLAQLARNHDDPLEVSGGREITMPATGDTFRVTDWEVRS